MILRASNYCNCMDNWQFYLCKIVPDPIQVYMFNHFKHVYAFLLSLVFITNLAKHEPPIIPTLCQVRLLLKKAKEANREFNAKEYDIADCSSLLNLKMILNRNVLSEYVRYQSRNLYNIPFFR